MRYIPTSQLDRAIYLVDATGAAEFLLEGLNLAGQGRPGKLPLRTWLIGALLTVETESKFQTTAIYHTLVALPLERQGELGVRYHDKDGQVRTVTKTNCDYHAKWLRERLACTEASAAFYEAKWKRSRAGQAGKPYPLRADQAELDRRRAVVQGTIDRLLDASIIQPGGSWYALDGSGTWSWGRSPRVLSDDTTNVRSQEEVCDDPSDDPTRERLRDHLADTLSAGEAPTDSDDTEAAHRHAGTRQHDPDARIGMKTSKSGKEESYFGYVLDAAIRVSPPGKPPVPVVVERLVVSPASTDVVGPTLAILDGLTRTPGGVDNVVVDRHYSYKRVDRWADELRRRGINQHFDMRADEHGFVDVNGMKLVDGWMHCPATPDHFAEIHRPGPTANKTTRETFARRIQERWTWALDRHESINSDGRTRWMCPATAGKIGCPLRDGSVDEAKASGLPIVTNPPDPATAPKCCTNASGIVSHRSDRMRKHQQPHYWGSVDWVKAYNLRTYVEGYFGSIKSRDTEGVGRGFTRFVGLPLVSLGTAIAAAVCNVRHQRKYYTDRPDAPDHPLLTTDEQPVGVRALTPAEVEALDQQGSAA